MMYKHACEGLDQLTAKVPALKESTPELIETAKVGSNNVKILLMTDYFIFRTPL